MIVVINTQELINKNISPSEFIFLNLLLEKNYAACEQFYRTFGSDLDVLNTKGFLPSQDAINAFVAGSIPLEELPVNIQKLNELFNLKDSYFWELFSTYPVKVPAGKGMQGYRILKTASLDAEQTKDLKKKYDKIVGTRNDAKHRHIMRCLEAELWCRKKDGSAPYMKRLETWINQHAWQEYEHMLELSNQRKISQDNYGEKII